MDAPLSVVLCGDTLPVEPLSDLPASAKAVFEVAAQGNLSLGNFEIPLSRRGAPVQKLLNIRADPGVAKGLGQLGLDVATVANNHAVDYGVEGLLDTVANLRSAGIETIGAGLNLETAASPFFTECNGRRIGILAFSCLTPTGMNAGANRPGIAGLRIETAYEIDPWYQMEEPGDPSVVKIRTRVSEDDLAFARNCVVETKKRCDILIVTLHWGFGSGDALAEYQRPLAEHLIDMGADVIHGHHPHAIHAFGFHRGKPIIYSAGTYVGQQVFLTASDAVKRLWADMSADGYITTLTFNESLEADVELRPTTLDQRRLPRFADKEEFEVIMARLRRLSSSHGAAFSSDGQVISVRSR
ncbi:CapA family protein [Agrobacterium pusense]|uniref:CapA family protein n=1 Tax=Agrobacterium pusense TaxID=648995 RepID=UPI0037BE91D0